MTESYLLALDIGTASIGYVAFSMDENNQPVSILDLGVRIFPDGREPKTKEPLAVGRRKARGMRRNRDRGQNRVRRLVSELIEFGLLPENELKRKRVFNEISPYAARARAVHEKVDAPTLARAIFHIGRRRGFKSNRLAGDEEDSAYKEKIAQLREKLGDQTLGEFLFNRIKENEKLAKKGKPIEQTVVRFRGGETEFYADRYMYETEFEQIRKTQGNNLLTEDQWDALQETAFWQYPLKPVPKGKCRFYPEENRAHIDLPVSHEFRICQEVNSLRYETNGEQYELNDRQRHFLYKLLSRSKSVTFKGLAKKKDKNKSPYFPSDATFNLDVASRHGKLFGNRVMCDMRKPEYLGELADSMESGKLNDIINYLIEPLKEEKGRQVVINTEELESWLQKQLPDLSDQQVKNLCKYRFKRDTASVSRKFMDQIVPVLKDTGLVYSDAVAQLEDAKGIKFHHSNFETGEVLRKLPYYGEVMPESVWGEKPEADKDKFPSERDEDAYQYGKIANPTVHVSLNQLRVVVNRVIDKLGTPPAKIHVELTRDLKNSKSARADIEKMQSKNRKDNDRIREILDKEFNIPRPHREDIQKYKLWEELGKQGARCSVFSGRAISAAQLFNGEVEIEHIIPFGRCYDDGMSNKTLAFKAENNQKRNKTPFEAFGNTDTYASMMKRALASFGQSSKYDRFKEGAFESFYGGEKGDMIERVLNDTKYISRKARQYLACLCHSQNVVPVNGRMTAVLRDVWQLNHFKDREAGHYRDDHRHHIVDAFVVGLTSRSLIQQLSTRRSGMEQTESNLYHFIKNRVKPIPEKKKELFEKLDSVIASYKPDHTDTGSMFNDTAYGIEHEEGQQWCITRKAVVDLSYSEIFQIRSKKHQLRLLQYLVGNASAENGKQLKKLVPQKEFDAKKQAFSVEAGVKKLRINIPNNSVKPIPSAPYKGYALNAYAYCDVWQIPYKKDPKTGKWEYRYQGAFVPYAEVKKYANNPCRPVDSKGNSHPAAKRLMRLYKDDNVVFKDNKTGEEKVMRIAGYSTSQNKLDIRPNLKAVNDGQKFESINSIFNKYQVSKLRM